MLFSLWESHAAWTLKDYDNNSETVPMSFLFLAADNSSHGIVSCVTHTQGLTLTWPLPDNCFPAEHIQSEKTIGKRKWSMTCSPILITFSYWFHFQKVFRQQTCHPRAERRPRQPRRLTSTGTRPWGTPATPTRWERPSEPSSVSGKKILKINWQQIRPVLC